MKQSRFMVNEIEKMRVDTLRLKTEINLSLAVYVSFRIDLMLKVVSSQVRFVITQSYSWRTLHLL